MEYPAKHHLRRNTALLPKNPALHIGTYAVMEFLARALSCLETNALRGAPYGR